MRVSKITQAPSAALRRARLATSVGFFLQAAILVTILSRLPTFEDERGVTEADVTIMLLLTSVIAGAGSLLAERIAVRHSSALALRLALLIISAMVVVVGLVESLPGMYVAFAVYGIGVGAADAATNMQGVTVQRLYGRSIMTRFHAMWSIGAIVGALYAAGSAELGIGLMPSLVALGLVGIVVTVVVSPSLVGPGVEQEVTHDSEGSAASLHVPWRPLLALGLVVIVFYLADTSVMSWSSLYLHKALDSSETVAPLGYAAYQLGAVISRLAGDRFVSRYGAVPVVRAGTVVGLVALFLVVAAPVSWMAIAAFGLMGLGLPIVIPLAFAAAGSIPGTDADVAIARLNLFNYVGNIVGAALIGALTTGGQLRWIYVVPLVLVPLILLVARTFAPEREIEAVARARP
ncbi:MFS transporter [Mumia sp.]|uniref:MFS transporter n=1 Tax=Mumia sp. TaxID=1965300 RepID=UPI00344B9401